MGYTGWLMPDGKFYPCKHKEHTKLLRELQSIREMIRFHGIPKNTFYQRKNKGLSLEQCLTPTMQKSNSRKKS